MRICIKWPDESQDIIDVPERTMDFFIPIALPLKVLTYEVEIPETIQTFTLIFRSTGRLSDGLHPVYEFYRMRRD